MPSAVHAHRTDKTSKSETVLVHIFLFKTITLPCASPCARASGCCTKGARTQDMVVLYCTRKILSMKKTHSSRGNADPSQRKIFLANPLRLWYSDLVNARNKRVGLATETPREDAPRLEARPSFRRAEVHLGAARLNVRQVGRDGLPPSRADASLRAQSVRFCGNVGWYRGVDLRPASG